MRVELQEKREGEYVNKNKPQIGRIFLARQKKVEKTNMQLMNATRGRGW